MRSIASALLVALVSLTAQAQLSPAITSWLQNTTETGSYYVSGNSTPINNGILVNCQQVAYTSDYVYITCTGIPSYPTGPFLDGNPSQAENQAAIFRFPLNPQQETGTQTETQLGNIGNFINGVALFDYRDGVAWDPTTNALCGGPGNPMCPGRPNAVMDWNRDAIPAENDGFDCSKGHPAMGNYHHHQNPSAFKLDQTVVSTICNLYDADGLYAIDSTAHSPLIGFAYDGFPIYGAYGYANADGTGGIARIKSSYELRNITTRTNGPNVDATYFLGYFREDYEYVDHSNEDDYLDEHNGRFCVTPEYPNGTYAYFCTVDENWNSAYPYGVGPTYYGVYEDPFVNAVPGDATVYDDETTGLFERNKNDLDFSVYPNPSTDLIAIQVKGLVTEDIRVDLFDLAGRKLMQTRINPGQTIAYFDIQTLYAGNYIVKLEGNTTAGSEKVLVTR